MKRKNNLTGLYLFFIFILLNIFLEGCIPTPYHKPLFKAEEFIHIDYLCKKHNLKLSFNTIDEIIEITSPDKEIIRFIIGSTLIYLNGNFFYLKKAPVYIKGKILVPVQLEKLITSQRRQKLFFHPLPINTIMLDPGHGGKDPGAISPTGLKEKDVNLKVCMYLKKALEKRGYKVHLTRDRDIYLTLKERAEIAKRKKVDLFISVHANANHCRRVRGIEVYYLASKYFDRQTKALINTEKLLLGEDESFCKNTERIIWDLLRKENYMESIELAYSLTFAFKKMEFYKVKAPRGAPFYVLKYAYVPAVLVEVGYLTNPYEERFLRKDSYLKRIAEAIALGVVSLDKYYTRLGRK